MESDAFVELLPGEPDFAGADLAAGLADLAAGFLAAGFAAAIAGLGMIAENNAATMNHGRVRARPGAGFMAKLSKAKGPGQVKHGREGFRAPTMRREDTWRGRGGKPGPLRDSLAVMPGTGP